MSPMGFLSLVVVIAVLPTSSLSFPRLRSGNGTVNPVILVPGDGGSQLQARLNKPSVSHIYCEKKTNSYFDLWLNLEQMVPYIIDCWVDNMRLVYNKGRHLSTNAPGVDIRVPGFGNTTTVEYLDSSKISVGRYFATIVEHMVSWGYERGVSVAAAPYDFRKAPNEQSDYFSKFKSLVEDMYNKNGGLKVVLMAHSMGNPYSLYFLNLQTQAWRDKYIHSFITMAGVWGGSAKPFKVFASGDNLDIWALSALKLRKGQRTYPSLSFLMPRPPYWNNTDVFVTTPHKNYTLSNLKEFFTDIGLPSGYDMYQDTAHIMDAVPAPHVPVVCLYGQGVKTGERFVYGKAFPNAQPNIVFGDGDGSVNIRSLKGCIDWRGEQQHPVVEQSFQGVDHMDILTDKNVLKYLKALLAPSRM